MKKIDELSPRERLEKVFQGAAPDRTPILGGWIACPDHICAITGFGLDAYWSDPVTVSIAAYQKLGMDGLVDVFVPSNRDDFRAVDAGSYQKASTGDSLEDTIARIEAMPSAEKIEAEFDLEREYAAFKRELAARQDLCGEMVYMPAQWEAGAKVSWYADFGYENFFLIIGLHPDHARKLMEVGGARGRCRSRVVARAVRDGIFPHAVFLGEDICTQRGPMVSPEFLEKYYAPQLQYALAPLLEAGCKPVWHCDGDVRPILDLVIDCGVQGLQGFQPECGMNLEYVVQKRTKERKPLLIFGPLAVTTELPVCTPLEIKAKVRQAIEICRGNADLVLFTSNTINPDIPLENIYAMYEAVRE